MGFLDKWEKAKEIQRPQIDIAKQREIVARGQKGKEFLDRPLLGQILSKEFAGQLPRAITEVVAGTPVKFAISALEAPGIITRGGEPTGKAYDVPLLGKTKSYQTEQAERVERIVEGDEPIISALLPFVEVPLAALETVAIAKGAVRGAEAIRAARSGMLKRKNLEHALKLTMPIRYKKGKISALEKAGKPGGAKVSKLTRRIGIEPSKEDLEVAKSVQDVISPRQNIVKNLERVNNKIARVSENEVLPFLKKNRTDIPEKEIAKALDKIEPSPLVKTDRTLENTFSLVKKRMLEVIREKKAYDNVKLWRRRIDMDEMMKNEFGDRMFNPEKNFAVKDAYLKGRDAINDLITTKTPGGKAGFGDQMKLLSKMFRARYNMAEGSYKMVGTTAIKRMLQKYPWLKRIVAYGLLGGGGYRVIRGINQ